MQFQSIYAPDFVVLEERRGDLAYFPHTDQLPRLHRALTLEFKSPLPARLSRLDHRGTDYEKYALWNASLLFCSTINARRSDRLLLVGLLDSNLVARVAIAQQVTEHTERGASHHFRFYAGADWFDEIRLSGKRLAFSTHAFQRFASRAPVAEGEELAGLLTAVLGAPTISVHVNQGRAFVKPYSDAVIALTYNEKPTEFFVTTCLTTSQINTLQGEGVPLAFNFHYGTQFAQPSVRHWNPALQMRYIHDLWMQRAQGNSKPVSGLGRWHTIGSGIFDFVKWQGKREGCRYRFLDDIPGPLAHIYNAEQEVPRFVNFNPS